MEDDILMQRAVSGDQDAFRALTERYGKEIFNYFVRSTGSIEDAEDLTQQCFINLYGSLGRYRRTASLRTFLYRIATNLAISFSRRRAEPVSLDLLIEEGYDPSSVASSDSAEDLAAARELMDAYLGALSLLPAEWRAVLDMRVGKELSYKEIADAMGRSVPAVESILFRAREKLADDMAPFLVKGHDRGRENE